MTIIAQTMPYSTAEVPRQSASIREKKRFIPIDFLLFGICGEFAEFCVTNWLNRTVNVANFSTASLVAAVALIDESGRVLLQKRHVENSRGGLWEFPGGKLEPGESAELTAIREISEELGLKIDPEDLELLTFASGPAAGPRPGAQLVILLYTCRRWRGVPACRGAEAIAGCRGDQLAGVEMPELDYPLAERVVGMLNGTWSLFQPRPRKWSRPNP